jgi:heterodisulfide reductase subunit C
LNIVSDLPPTEMPLVKGLSFQRRVINATAGDSRLEMCIQCGTCGGSCPSGPDMDHTPRHLFAMIRAGMEKEVLSSNTPFYCVSCYFCMTRCPQEVHITDIMYTLKRMSIDAGFVSTKAASDLSQSFVGAVEKYGRSFEFGLATRQFLRHHARDLLKVAPMGLGMLTRGRMDLTPHRIDGLDELNAILDRAKTLDKELLAEVMP